ncbi:Kae1-like domain-containing protein [Phosphitispora fastidiosa]|uniref:Kae1-like domain-containing protein n=1 Tax=Phosphitispora fastidiosa TaxID=2837202 RepID=UPI001E372942|nr:O-sialoglycoprotein endopeptidase [Phosphitispora fastidiosa]MBU7007640.1 N6-L-threonylcarbamoyladenine synthase [Phosphitispora fastidiosa]
MEKFLGIDTSCYTTSLAVVDGEGNLLSEARKILDVRIGARGLAQSEAVFQHINNLPLLFEHIAINTSGESFAGIAASVRPRPVKSSYMPVFRVAESYGNSIAAMLNIPFADVSHQEGHLAAGIMSAGGPRTGEFLAIHLSGGTTELLRVKKGVRPDEPNFAITIIGETRDLHAGQFIDRVGVRLGLPFPAGPHLEQLAAKAQGEITVPSSVKGCDISFSGPEAAALRLVGRGIPPAEIARAVEKCVANTLEKVIRKAVMETGIREVLIVGGVAANRFIRERLGERLQHGTVGARVYFASRELSGDNAVGTALLGMSRFTNKW